jgi:tetratricopeptide (TPR) repeat protein
MKTAVFTVFLVCSAAFAMAQERLADQLRKGIVQEEANQNLEKAIQAYQAIVAQFDQDRKAAATALFRLAECYRKTGKREQAVAAYQRVVREFSDKASLVEPSRQQLASTYGISEPKLARATSPAAAREASGQTAQAVDRDILLRQQALKAAVRDMSAAEDKIKDYQIQNKKWTGALDSTEYRQLQRDLEAARDRLVLAQQDLKDSPDARFERQAATPRLREVTPEMIQSTQFEMQATQKQIQALQQRVEVGQVPAGEVEKLKTQYEILKLRYQQQVKALQASEAAARDARVLDERMIESVQTEIGLIQQRIALLEKQVEAGTASSGSAELLQLRRDLLGLQRKLDELKAGIRR